MGMSLPFLDRAMVRDAETASQTIGFLYGINVLGAAVGALATPWVFIRHHGIRAAILAAVAANLIAGRVRARPGPVGTEGQIGGKHGRGPGDGARARKRRPGLSGCGSLSTP